jgi:CBS domain-containing protein
MLIRDVMSRNVVTVRPHMPIRAAAALLVANGFASAPVVTAEGVLFGIVTAAGLTRGPFADPDDADADAAPATTAREVMTPDPPIVRSTDSVTDCVDVMLASGLPLVPVVDEGRLVGIVSRSDVVPWITGDVDADLVATSPA